MWIIKSPTIPVGSLWSWRLRGDHWTQSLCLRGILYPSPIHHLPSLKAGHSYLMMFFQNHEWCGLGKQFWIGPLGKYFALKVLVRREWGLWWIRQNCLLIMAWFIVLNFFRPSPPSLLGWQTLSHFIRCNFLSPVSCPHQNALTTASILLQMYQIPWNRKKHKGEEIGE